MLWRGRYLLFGFVVVFWMLVIIGQCWERHSISGKAVDRTHFVFTSKGIPPYGRSDVGSPRSAKPTTTSRICLSRGGTLSEARHGTDG